MRSTLACLLLPVLVLSACQKADEDGETAEAAETAEPVGSYDIDPESGEVSASHKDASGVVTEMRAGENVVARFPEPFTAYPGATITNTTQVDRGEGVFVTVEFTTPDARDKVVAFYRAQAEEAGITPDIEVSGGETTTLGGENMAERASFALQVTRVGETTEGQLSVARGFD